jgi:sugar lactone lactonase YvrE
VNSDGIITTVAGDGLFASRGDRGSATQANLAYPTDVAVDTSGNYYIADRNNSLVRKVTSIGIISQIMGTGITHFNGDQGLAPETNLHLPFALTLSADEKYLYIVDRNHFRIRKLEFATQRVVTIAGNGDHFQKGNQGHALGALLNGPWGLEIDKSGNLIVADQSNNTLKMVTPEGFIFNLAGNGKPGESGDGKPATSATLHKPTTLVYDRYQNLYIAVRSGNGWRIRKINPQGQISWYAGNSKVGTEGDGGLAKNASFYVIAAMAADSAGNLYIADRANPFIRKIDPKGIITKIGGTDWSKLKGDIHPNGIVVDAKKNIYVSDSGSSLIWKIEAQINGPTSMVFDQQGNLYFTDRVNGRIRKVDTQGIISTVAGKEHGGFLEEGLEINLIVHNFP